MSETNFIAQYQIKLWPPFSFFPSFHKTIFKPQETKSNLFVNFCPSRTNMCMWLVFKPMTSLSWVSFGNHETMTFVSQFLLPSYLICFADLQNFKTLFEYVCQIYAITVNVIRSNVTNNRKKRGNLTSTLCVHLVHRQA